MKKVGIVTYFQNASNYGTAIQAYALVYIVRRLGYDAEVVNIDFTPHDSKSFFVGKINSAYVKVKKNVKFIGKILKDSPEVKKARLKAQKRMRILESFREEYIPHSELIHCEELMKIKDKYDILIAGSDQIWNPVRWKQAFFLDWAGKNTRRIVYAASMGVNEYTEHQKLLIEPYFSFFDAISVREKEGVQIIGELTNKKIEIVLDPVLLLEKHEWQNIVKDVKQERPYVLCYLLGDNDTHKIAAKRLAEMNHLQLVSLHGSAGINQEDVHFGDKKFYEIDPGQFIWLIENAEIIVTDSFHGTVVSIVNHKKCYVFRRDAANERIYMLLDMLGLRSMLLSEQEDEWDFEVDWDRFYVDVDKRLSEERKKSIDFLKNALSGRNGE